MHCGAISFKSMELFKLSQNLSPHNILQLLLFTAQSQLLPVFNLIKFVNLRHLLIFICTIADMDQQSNLSLWALREKWNSYRRSLMAPV